MAMARGGSKRDVAAQFPPLHFDSIDRHFRNHVTDDAKAMMKATFLRPGVPIAQLVGTPIPDPIAPSQTPVERDIGHFSEGSAFDQALLRLA